MSSNFFMCCFSWGAGRDAFYNKYAHLVSWGFSSNSFSAEEWSLLVKYFVWMSTITGKKVWVKGSFLRGLPSCLKPCPVKSMQLVIHNDEFHAIITFKQSIIRHFQKWTPGPPICHTNTSSNTPSSKLDSTPLLHPLQEKMPVWNTVGKWSIHPLLLFYTYKYFHPDNTKRGSLYLQ